MDFNVNWKTSNKVEEVDLYPPPIDYFATIKNYGIPSKHANTLLCNINFQNAEGHYPKIEHTFYLPSVLHIQK